MIAPRHLAGGLACALLALGLAVHGWPGWAQARASVHGWLQSAPAAAAAGMASPVNVGFARGMLVHHDQAVSMSRMALSRAGPSVRALAQGILEQQLLEIGWFQGWLTVWGRAPDGDTDMQWMEEGYRRSGMRDLALERLLAACRANGPQAMGLVAAQEMDALSALQGGAFDQRYLRLMVAHHQGALAMARFASDLAESEHVRNVARSIQLEQSAEIPRMLQMADALAVSTGDQAR